MLSDISIKQFWLIKILQINAISKIVWSITLVCSVLYLAPILVQMGFNGRIVFNMYTLYLAFYSIVCVNQPQPRPLIAISLDISATKNRSNKFLGSLALVGIFAVGKNLVSFLCGYNEGFVTACFNPIIYFYIPIFEWSPHRLNFTLDALLNRREDNPTV